MTIKERCFRLYLLLQQEEPGECSPEWEDFGNWHDAPSWRLI